MAQEESVIAIGRSAKLVPNGTVKVMLFPVIIPVDDGAVELKERIFASVFGITVTVTI